MTIFVVGSINIDVCLEVTTLPAAGQTVTAHNMYESIGGKGYNQAFAAHRLGIPTCFVGCVGPDDAGRKVIQALTAASLDPSAIAVNPTLPTGTASICVDENGQNTIVLARGANGAVSPSLVENWSDKLCDSKILMLQMEINCRTNISTAKLAQENGVFVCFDPAPVGSIDEINSIIALSDIVTPNESETYALTGIHPSGKSEALKAAEILRGRGANAVILKLGARGVFVHTDKLSLHIPSFKVAAIDSVAAGDCFNAGFAAALHRGKSVAESARYGAAAGALATTKLGGSTSAPLSEEVDALLY